MTQSLWNRMRQSPAALRIVPFAVFLGLTACQGQFGEAGRYWIYLLKTLAGAGLLWAVWKSVSELKWRLSWEAVLIGIAVFVMWVGLDDFIRWLGFPESYPKLGKGGTPWNPHEEFGRGTVWAWWFIVVRIVGSTLVVPPLEEVFYRSFLYRWIVNPDFQSVSLRTFKWGAYLFTAVLFASTHHHWLAAFFCALAYQGLVCWKNRLGDAMTAHAITNLLLGLWVVGKGEWTFW